MSRFINRVHGADEASIAVLKKQNAELVEALEAARVHLAATPQRIRLLAPVINKIDALLAKIGGDA